VSILKSPLRNSQSNMGTALTSMPLGERRVKEFSRVRRVDLYFAVVVTQSSLTVEVPYVLCPLVRGEEHAFKVVDPGISSDRPSSMGRSSARA
jgi:hypothetical protein